MEKHIRYEDKISGKEDYVEGVFSGLCRAALLRVRAWHARADEEDTKTEVRNAVRKETQQGIIDSVAQQQAAVTEADVSNEQTEIAAQSDAEPVLMEEPLNAAPEVPAAVELEQ